MAAAELLRFAAAQAGETLLPSAGLDRVLAAVAALELPQRGLFLERPLGPSGDRVDLLVAFRERPGERQQVGRLPFPEAGAWGPTGRFFRAWAAAEAPWAAVGLSLLELDLLPGAAPAPGVHLCLDPGFVRGGLEARSNRDAGAARAWVEAASRLIRGRGLDTLEQGQLVAIEAAGAALLHASFLPGRAGCPGKLNLLLPTAELAAFLRRLGWPGEAEAAAAWSARLAPGLQWAKLDWPLGPAAPRLGLELAVPQGEAGRCVAIAEALADAGLCTPVQARALGAWTGSSPALGGHLDRRLQLKLVLGDGPPTAKAYLELAHRRSPLARDPFLEA